MQIFIGPNGYGKTTKLKSIQANLESELGGSDQVLFLDSEIKLLDEVKDTVDSSKTMEYILFELLRTNEYSVRRMALEEEVDRLISSNQARMNGYLDEILGINESERAGEFITPTDASKKVYKGLVSINSKDVKDKTGSGQRMQLLLKLVQSSSKAHIILDEPEKYSHPSMLHRTARMINELNEQPEKSVYLATHSPKLLSMLKFDINNLFVINDPTHETKGIDIDGIITELNNSLPVANMKDKEKRYYESAAAFNSLLATRHYRDFMESLFARTVFLCEGINDAVFIQRTLNAFGGFYGDYHIFKTYGKFPMPVFLEIFNSLGIKTFACFDADDTEQVVHREVNEFLASRGSAGHLVFSPTIEKELGFLDDKNDTLLFAEHIDGLQLDERCRCISDCLS